MNNVKNYIRLKIRDNFVFNIQSHNWVNIIINIQFNIGYSTINNISNNIKDHAFNYLNISPFTLYTIQLQIKNQAHGKQ